MTTTTTKTLEDQIKELHQLPVARLRERYAEVFGEPTTSANRQWLLRRVAWRIQALQEGDLSERARRRAAELVRDADVRMRPPQAIHSAGMAQARHGARLMTVTGRLVSKSDQRLPAPGTMLRREYKGVEYHVAVLPSGFEHEGKVYRTLSAVATAITGSHWNGFLFFGLTAKENA